MADEKLPYSLKNLQWDANHFFNAQNKYSYTGKGRKLGDPALQCDLCEQWFLCKDVACVPKDAGFVAFQRNYRFSCRICTQGPEQFELQTNTWTSIVLTAVYNLLLTDDGAGLRPGVYLKVKDIVAWLRDNWGSLAAGRDLGQLVENSAVQKCILYPQNSALFTVSDDRSEVLLKHVAASKLLLKPLVSSAVPNMTGIKPKNTVASGGAGARGRKRGAGGKAGAKDAKQPKVDAAPPAPTLDQIKLPDKYRLLPVPKADVSAVQDPSVVQLSRSARAPQIALKEDERGVALTAVGYKGYRMVRATHGVASGSWYYEVTVGEPLNGEDGHTRIGWSSEAGELQAPVGYDVNSYSYRDVNGAVFHESSGKEYGASYGPGDVIGCLLTMGDPPAARRERQRISLKGVEYIVEEERQRVVSTGSSVSFFKNGVSQGVAFEGVWAEVYYPAASLYKAATVEFNFGPNFKHPPPADVDARPLCELATPKEEPAGNAEAAEGAAAADGDEEGEEGDEPEAEEDLMQDEA